MTRHRASPARCGEGGGPRARRAPPPPPPPAAAARCPRPAPAPGTAAAAAAAGTAAGGRPPFPPPSHLGGPGAAVPPRPLRGRNDGSRHSAALLPLRAALRGVHGAPCPPAPSRGPATRHAPPPAPPAPRRPPAPQDLPQLPAPLPPHLQLRPLPGPPGQARGAHLQVLPGQPWPCLPVQLRGERGLWPGGAAAAADGAALGGRHLLPELQDHPGLEIRAGLREQPEVQGGEVHHRDVTHGEGERLGLRGTAGAPPPSSTPAPAGTCAGVLAVGAPPPSRLPQCPEGTWCQPVPPWGGTVPVTSTRGLQGLF